jgi:hypothetical protein
MDMAYRFDIDQRAEVVLFTAEGVFTAEEFLLCIGEVVADSRFRRGFSHFVDLREVERFPVDGEDTRRRVGVDIDLGPRLGDAKIAIVSSRNHVYGISRMYQALMEGSDIQVETFRDVAKAREWLGLPVEESIPDE